MIKMALIVISGPMFSYKTTELERLAGTEKIADRKVMAFKPRIDDRYSNEPAIISHDGKKMEATLVDLTEEIWAAVNKNNPEVIVIDEVQFLDDKIVEFCYHFRKIKDIYLAVLNMDYRGEPFRFKDSQRNVGELMAMGQNISLKAVCTFKFKDGRKCGSKDAVYTQRLINGEPAPYNSPLILVGSKEAYEARCSRHHIIEKP